MINCGLGWGIKFNALDNFLEKNLLKTNFLISLKSSQLFSDVAKKKKNTAGCNVKSIYDL